MQPANECPAHIALKVDIKNVGAALIGLAGMIDALHALPDNIDVLIRDLVLDDLKAQADMLLVALADYQGAIATRDVAIVASSAAEREVA